MLVWLKLHSYMFGVFGSLVKVESTYWGVIKLFNTQNKLMEVHQSDVSKILLSSTSNLVFLYSSNLATSRRLISFSSIKQVTPLASFSSSSFHMSVAQRAHLLFLRGKIVRGITTTLYLQNLFFPRE